MRKRGKVGEGRGYWTEDRGSPSSTSASSKKKKVYDTAYSRVVTLPSTDAASTSLDSVSETGTVAFSCVWP